MFGTEEVAAQTPTVSAVSITSSPESGDTYGLEETIRVSVTFDRNIAVDETGGLPQVALMIGSQTRSAGAVLVHNDSLQFTYVVQASDRDTDGIDIGANALTLNGAVITIAGGSTPANLNLGSHAVSTASSHKVDGSQETAPTVSDVSITSSPDGGDTYGLEATIRASVFFNKNITWSGAWPSLTLTVGSQPRSMTFAAFGSNSLTFEYVVRAADRDTDGVSIGANALALNGGTVVIKGGSAAVNTALGTHAISNDSSHKVDGSQEVAPTVSGVNINSSPESGDTYGLQEPIRASVFFNKNITWSGAWPSLTLTVGSQPRSMTFAAFGSNSLTFEYVVRAADRDTDGVSIGANALALNGGTVVIKGGSAAVNTALGTHAISNDSSHKVDGSQEVAPVVTGVSITSSPTSGTSYDLGENIDASVTFNKNITRSSSSFPTLALEIGSQTRVMGLVSVGNNSLQFRYTVQGSDQDPDGISIKANALTNPTAAPVVIAGGSTAVNAALGTHAILNASNHKVSTPEIVLSESALAVTEGQVEAYTVTLNRQPSGNVQVSASRSSEIIGIRFPGESSWVATKNLDFTMSNWNTAQTVQVHAFDDNNTEDASETITHAVVDAQSVSDFDDAPDKTLTVNVNDDDEPRVTLALSSSSITENGGEATVTATLDLFHGVAVTVPVSATAVSPAVANDFMLSAAPTLTIAAGQTTSTGTVTVTAVNNATDAPDKSVTISGTASDSLSLAHDPSSLMLTLTDDDAAPGVTLTLSDASIAENGGVSTVSATLSHPSSEATTVTVTPQATFFTVPPGAAGQIVIAAGMTAAAGDVVTITAVNDDVYRGNGRATPVSATLANSQGTGTVTPATLTLTDDESLPTVTLALSTTAVTENGGIATVTATLSGTAGQAVTLTVAATPVSPAVAGDFALSPAPTLTIAAGATTSTGTVTVTAVDNAVNAADKTVTVSATAAGGHGVSAPSAVTLTLTDDDTPGIAVVPATATDAAVRPLRTTESGDMATFTVALTSRPTGAVVLDLASSNTAEGTVLPTALTFAATDWNTAQPVTLTGVDDDMATPPNPPDGNRDYSVTLTTTSTADVDYNALAAVTVYAVNADNEYGLDLSVGAVTVTEAGGSATFTVALITQPSAAVTVAVSSLDSSEGRVSPAALTFAATAWNTAQTVRVTGVDDAIHDGPVTWQVRLDSSSGDSNYHGLADLDVSVITTDDETAPDVTLALASAAIPENGGSTAVRATLTRASGAATTVTVTPVTGAYTVGSGAAGTIVIPAGQTANAGDTATVIAVDDTIHQGSVGRSTTVTATLANDVGTGSVTGGGAALTLTDNEAPPGATLALSDASIPEMGGTSVVSATLSGASAAATTVTVTDVSGFYTVGSDAIIAIPAGATANAADTVTITAVDNATNEPDRTTTVTGTLANSRGAGTVSGVTLTLEDNDAAPTVTLAVSSTSITENNGQTMVSATLSNPSSAETTVTVTAVANAYTVASGTGATILLAAGSTASTDTATITAVDNARNAADNVVTVTATAANDQGVGTVTGPMLTITDDDIPGVTVAPPTSAAARLRTTESGSMGGTATFAVTLATEPTGAVVLDVASSDTMEGTVLPAALTFQTADWNTEQTVTLTGVDDDPPTPSVPNQKAGTRDYTVTLTVNAAATADSDYDALGAVTVYAKNADNEYGLDLSGNALTVEEAGGTATFTVALFTQPTGDVLVAVASRAPNDVTVSPGSLTFTSGTWETKQTVTVTGVDDDVYDPTDPSYDVVLNPSSTADANYNGLDDETVTVTTEDDDELPTVTLALSPPAISENNEVATVSATLSGKTSEAVTLTVSATAGTNATDDDFTLSTDNTLTIVTIAAEQTTSTGLVTLTTVDNHVDTPDKGVTLSATATGGHGVAPPPNATLTITDDDEPGLVIAPTALELEEPPADAPTATYTVQLATEPMAAVTVTVMKVEAAADPKSNPDVVMVLPTALTFDASTWNTAQMVTVTTEPEDKNNYRHDIVDLIHTAMPDEDADADHGYVSLSAAVTVRVTDRDDLPMLRPGKPITVNGHQVTMRALREGETLPFTLTPPRSLDFSIHVDWGRPADTLSEREKVEGKSYSLVPATGLDISVTDPSSDDGDELTKLSEAEGEGAGTPFCLTVTAEARIRGETIVYLLHRRNDGTWTKVGEGPVENDKICGTVTDFSVFMFAFEDRKPTFEKQAEPLVFTTSKADEKTLPAATGGNPPLSYFVKNPETLPDGLIHEEPADDEADGGKNKITGTATTPSAPQQYTLIVRDRDGDEVPLPFTIEVKSNIESRDLALVLAGIGRTLASDAVEVLGGRFGSAPASRLQITLGGQVLRLTQPAAASTPSSSSSPPSPLAGEGQGEGVSSRVRGALQGEGNLPQGERNVLQGEGSPLQGEATPAPASGPSPWQQATGLALSVAQALGVNLNLPASGSPSPLAGEGRGEGGILQGQGEFLQSDTLSGRLPTDRRRSTSTSTANLFRLQPVSAKDLLARSAFELPLTRTGDDGVPAWTLWGRGSAAGFAGQPEDDFTMDGTLYSGYLGLDYRHASLLMGLAVAHSTGEVNYERTGATKAGADVQLTSVLPYVHWQPYAGLGVWGLLGAGWGEMDLKLEGDPQTRSTRLNSWLGAVGGRQTLTTWQGIDLAAKTDAFLTTVRAAGTAEVPEAQGHAQRVRLLLEGRTAVEVSPVSLLEPRLELGGRWDSGTAEQGLGAELGGGVAYTRTDWGLSVDAQGRYLLVHEDGGFEDWGASVNVRVDPGVAGQGLYLTVSPVWGQASSGVEQLWSPTAALSQASGPARPGTGWRPGRVDVDVGYGLALAEGRVLTPYGGLALGSPGSSRYRLGSRLALNASLAVNVEAERAEQPGQATAHSVSIRLGWQW